MQIKFSEHALKRMKERDVSQGNVMNALLSHHSCWRTPTGSFLLQAWIPSNGELKVWVDALPNERNTVTVISTAWSERQ